MHWILFLVNLRCIDQFIVLGSCLKACHACYWGIYWFTSWLLAVISRIFKSLRLDIDVLGLGALINVIACKVPSPWNVEPNPFFPTRLVLIGIFEKTNALFDFGTFTGENDVRHVKNNPETWSFKSTDRKIQLCFVAKLRPFVLKYARRQNRS